jgi:hypothetical protein
MQTCQILAFYCLRTGSIKLQPVTCFLKHTAAAAVAAVAEERLPCAAGKKVPPPLYVCTLLVGARVVRRRVFLIRRSAPPKSARIKIQTLGIKKNTTGIKRGGEESPLSRRKNASPANKPVAGGAAARQLSNYKLAAAGSAPIFRPSFQTSASTAAIEK